MEIKQMDTTSAALKGRMEKIAEAQGREVFAQETHKLAVAGFWLDMLGVEGEARKAAIKQWLATHSGFGANASQFRQVFEPKKGATAKPERENIDAGV